MKCPSCRTQVCACLEAIINDYCARLALTTGENNMLKLQMAELNGRIGELETSVEEVRTNLTSEWESRLRGASALLDIAEARVELLTSIVLRYDPEALKPGRVGF